MFDAILINTLFLLASLLVCLLTLRLSINIKNFMSLFSFSTDINGYFEIAILPTLPPISDPPVYFDPPVY